MSSTSVCTAYVDLFITFKIYKVNQCCLVFRSDFYHTAFSCSLVSPCKKLYLTFVSRKYTIFVYHITEIIGAIFHPARIDRFTMDWWGRKRCSAKENGSRGLRWKRRVKKSIHAPCLSSVSSIVPSNRLDADCLTQKVDCNIHICFPLVM